MGCTDVLRLLDSGIVADRAFLFGCGIGPAEDRRAYWGKRFHTDRGLQTGTIREDKVFAIRSRYYDNRTYLGKTPPNPTPVVVVTAEHDFQNMISARPAIIQALGPGASSGTIPGSDHYFNSLPLRLAVIGDFAVTRSLSAVFLPSLPSEDKNGQGTQAAR
jgi:hypothetical protein